MPALFCLVSEIVRRPLLITCGLIFVGLAFLGIALPGLPTVPFLLVAVACFARSSTRLYDWLLANRMFGPLLRDWQENRTIPPRARVLGIATILIVGYFSIRAIEYVPLKVLVALLLSIPIVILLLAKTSNNDA